MATELDFCIHLLEKFLKFWETNKAPYLEIFLDPVDEVEDHAPGYYAEISRPMDLSTMATKLVNRAYTDALAFKADFNLMIQNCRDYNSEDPNFIKKYADRFVKEFEWEWSEMRKWQTTERRKLAREAAAQASAPSVTTAAPATSTSGNERYVSESSLIAEIIGHSSRPSPSPSLGSPQGNSMATSRLSASNITSASKRCRQDAEDVDDQETPKRVRVSDSSEDAVDMAVDALRGIMAEQIDAAAAEKAGMAASTLALWGKIWDPRATRHPPRSGEPIEVLQAWTETVNEQLALVEQEDEAAKAVERAKFLSQLDKHSITMPPKQISNKASKAHSDSTYEDSEPETQSLRKPRITLKRGKSALNMNETDIPIHSRTRVRKLSQDQIYKDLLSRPAANEPAPKRQRVSLASPLPAAITATASSATIAGKSHQDLFNDYTKNLVSEEIEKQAKALDFSRDSGLSSKARVYGQFLFTAPYQFERTKRTWMELAMQRVDAMSMAELRNGGIETAVKDALIQTIGDETKNQAVLFG
ncbi:hypothetical protein KCU77_g4315, partial [Aureobasidium melanogenum]